MKICASKVKINKYDFFSFLRQQYRKIYGNRAFPTPPLPLAIGRMFTIMIYYKLNSLILQRSIFLYIFYAEQTARLYSICFQISIRRKSIASITAERRFFFVFKICFSAELWGCVSFSVNFAFAIKSSDESLS